MILFLRPVFFPEIINAERCLLSFHAISFVNLLDDVPLAIHENIWFQLDGAPPLHGRNIRNHLNQIIPNHWTG